MQPPVVAAAATADATPPPPPTTTKEQQSQQTQALASRVHCFSEQAPDATLHFQVLDLGQQLYVWLGAGPGAGLPNLYMAIQQRHDPIPAVATLLPDATSSTTASLAQRLARRVGRPVVCSCSLPAGSEMLQVIAERRLCQELNRLGFTKSSSGGTGGSGGEGGASGSSSGTPAPS